MTVIAQIYKSFHNDVFHSLTFERFLMSSISVNPSIPLSMIYFWKTSPTISMGRYQNVTECCNLPLILKDGISLCRRYSGGGTILQDEGCINVSIIRDLRYMRYEDSTVDIQDRYLNRSQIEDRNFHVIISGLRNLGIPCMKSGRNDIILSNEEMIKDKIKIKLNDEGRKMCGSAFVYQPRRVHLQHSSILFSADMELMGKYLIPNELKLKSKGIDTITRRVINIRDIRDDINENDLCSSIEDSFIEDLTNWHGLACTPKIDYHIVSSPPKIHRNYNINQTINNMEETNNAYSHKTNETNEEIKSFLKRSKLKLKLKEKEKENMISKESYSEPHIQLNYKKLFEDVSSHSFIYGEEMTSYKKISGYIPGVGLFDIHVNLISDYVTDIKIYSDTMYPEVIYTLETLMKGVKLEKKTIDEIINKIESDDFNYYYDNSNTIGKQEANLNILYEDKMNFKLICCKFFQWLSSDISKHVV